MKIPVAKPYLDAEDAQSAYDTILTGWVTQGAKVQAFEENFAQYVGAKHAVAVSSCTTALHLAMIVAGVGKDDEVICPSLSYIATANAIRYTGAKVVLADINPLTYNIDIADTKRKITPRTKAILIVHQIGLPADIDAFAQLCEEKGLILIEDAACAVGSAYKGRKIGAHSDLVCFSFHPRKVITTGDGGMITTSRNDYAERLKLLRQHGMAINDRVRHEASQVLITDHVELGYNYRMTDIQASVGIKQLAKLDWIVQARRDIAQQYHEAFADVPFLRLPIEPEGYHTNWQSYMVYILPTCPINRNDLMQKLLDEGVSTRSGVMTIHRETAYKGYYAEVSLPTSEDVCDRSIILPLYAQMTQAEIDFVIQRLKACFA